MTNTNTVLTDTNNEILTILSRDARTTPEQISKITGQPVEKVAQVISEFESNGVIRGCKAVIDWDKAGAEKVVAFIDVKVAPARDSGYDAVALKIARFPEVKSVWLVSGHNDLRVLVHGKDLRDLGRFVAEKLATIEGVRDTETHFMTRRYKEDDEHYFGSEEEKRGRL